MKWKAAKDKEQHIAKKAPTHEWRTQFLILRDKGITLIKKWAGEMAVKGSGWFCQPSKDINAKAVMMAQHRSCKPKFPFFLTLPPLFDQTSVSSTSSLPSFPAASLPHSPLFLFVFASLQYLSRHPSILFSAFSLALPTLSLSASSPFSFSPSRS